MPGQEQTGTADDQRARIRDRVIGGLVITLLAVAFLPMAFDGDGVHPQLRGEPDLEDASGLTDVPTVAPDPDDWNEEDWNFPAVAEELSQGAEVDGTPAGQVRLVPDDDQSAEVPPQAPDAAEAVEEVAAAEPAPESAAPGPEVVPEPTPAAPAQLGSWAVQVGAFRSAERARELRDRLSRAGLNVMLSERTNNSGVVITRVATGPHVSRAEANLAAAELRQRHGLEPLVVRTEL